MRVTILSALILGCFIVGCAGTAYVPQPPPAPRHQVIPMKPGPSHIWIEGHWKWNGRSYVWVDGRWVVRKRAGSWVDGRWEKRPRGWVWIPGHYK